jgi:hypothetical protein
VRSVGLLDRLRGRPKPSGGQPESVGQVGDTPRITACIYGGDETLDIVGESYRQEVLWKIVGVPPGSQVRHPVHAVLHPEMSNPHDPNAISVHIDGHLVGYLAREDAAAYRPGLLALMAREGGKHIALEGMVVGGSDSRSLGVFLDHDPEDFGLSRTGPPPVFRG